METKKSPRQDLESKKGIFLQMGFIIALSLVLIAFEWSSPDVRINRLGMIEDTDVEVDLVPVVIKEKIKEEIKMPTLVDVILITDELAVVDEDFYVPDPEDPMPDFSFPPILEEETREDIYTNVQEMPEFPGGNEGFARYLASALKYPEIAQINGVQGRVYVSFVVNKLGEITQVVLTRGSDPNLDREALRVVAGMPKWKPGMQNSKPVNVWYTVPISFVLQ